MSSFNVFDLFCIEVFNALAAFLYCVGTFIECLNFVSISDCFVREDFAFVYVFVCLMVRLRLSTNMNWRRCEHVSWMTAQSLTFSCFSNRQRAAYRALCAGTKWTLFDGSHTTKHVRSAIFTFALLSHKKKIPNWIVINQFPLWHQPNTQNWCIPCVEWQNNKMWKSVEIWKCSHVCCCAMRKRMRCKLDCSFRSIAVNGKIVLGNCDGILHTITVFTQWHAIDITLHYVQTLFSPSTLSFVRPSWIAWRAFLFSLTRVMFAKAVAVGFGKFEIFTTHSHSARHCQHLLGIVFHCHEFLNLNEPKVLFRNGYFYLDKREMNGRNKWNQMMEKNCENCWQSNKKRDF